MIPRGRFISFEGSEACGKSTQIRALLHRLQQQGTAVEVLREPGGTMLGEEIRHLLKHSPKGEGMTAETELLLFAASRAQLVREKIRPALAAGTWVLADRFVDSTTVYQGRARGLPMETLATINRLCVGDCMPELTFLLDLDIDQARRRQSAAAKPLDRLERESHEFFEKVRQGYLDLAAQNPNRIFVVEANQSPEEVSAQIWTILEARSYGFSR